MNQIILTFKKMVAGLVITLATTAGTQAQITWNGIVNLSAGQTINENITLTGDVTVAVASGTANINGVISGNYRISKIGANGTLSINSVSVYTGLTTITGGTLRIGDGTRTGNLTATAGVELNNTGARLEFATPTDITFNRVISGTGSVLKWERSKVILTAVNTYTGITHVGNGTLQVGNGTSGSIGNARNVTVTTDDEGVEDAVLRFEPGADMVFDIEIGGRGGRVEYKGASNKQLFLTGRNAYTGTTTVEEGGTLNIGHWNPANTVAFITGDIINHGNVIFRRSNAYTYNGVISGTGNVVQAGSGASAVLTLTAVHTYTGHTGVHEGTLVIAPSCRITNSSDVRFGTASAKLSIAATQPQTVKGLNSSFAETEVILGSTIFIGTGTTANDGNGTFAGRFTGGGSVIKSGTGTLTLTGVSTYTGGTQISAGTLIFSAGSNLGMAHINFAGGTLRWAPGNTVDISSGFGWINGNFTFDTNGNNITFATPLQTTAHTVTKAGAGTLTLNANQTYTGATAVTGGTLQFNGTLATSGINISSGANVTFNRAAELTYPGVISGAGTVNKLSEATLVLSGNNTYTGNTTVTAGTLCIGENGTTGSIAGNIALNDGTTLRFRRSNEYTFAGVISGAGKIEKIGRAHV